MSGTRYDSTHINDFVRAFLEGTVDIVPFKNEMDEHEEIYDFLQDIIDNIKTEKSDRIRFLTRRYPAACCCQRTPLNICSCLSLIRACYMAARHRMNLSGNCLIMSSEGALIT